jgi:hypothetical protein
MDIIRCPVFHLEHSTMESVQNCDSYINRQKPIDSINLLLSWRRRNVFPVRYEQTYRVELSFNKRQDDG